MRHLFFRCSLLLLIVGSSLANADAYRTYEQVQDAISALEQAHPDIAKVYEIGTTEEGRTIRAIKISDNPQTNEVTESDVLLVGGHHAREWISVEVPLRIAEYLVSHYNDAEVKALVDNHEIWVIPLLNADGYTYSWLPSSVEHGCSLATYYEPRCWRKNRRNLPFAFHGVDLNRNYGFHFGEGPHSSGNWSSDEYRGSGAFSEPETNAIKTLIENPNHQFTRLLSYHSYSQKILYPWSYSTDKAPDDALLKSIADELKSIMTVHSYEVKQGSRLYGGGDTVGGDLTDWAYGEKGILAYTIELPPLSQDPGFVLPPSEIQSTFEENRKAAFFFIGLSRGRLMDFEEGIDRAPIRTAIPGMQFTTTQGYDWIYADWRTRGYNGPYPNGAYFSNGNLFAWLGANQGAGQIDFDDGGYKTVGLSYSSLNSTFLEGYNSAGVLVDSSSGPGNLNTGNVGRLSITGDIKRVVVHDAGNFWLIDDLFVTDALGDAQSRVPGKYVRELQAVEQFVVGQSKTFTYFNSEPGREFTIVLQWPGSEFRLRVRDPSGNIISDVQKVVPPILARVEDAAAGLWSFEVTAIDLAKPEAAALIVGVYDPNDWDRDGVRNEVDNCRVTKNTDQSDIDGDGVGDACDNCPTTRNEDQLDMYPVIGPEGPGNGIGDACEALPEDMDQDGIPNVVDNCPYVPNSDQRDSNGNGVGDACDGSTPVNRPPTSDAGPDQTVECTDKSGASITLDGTKSSDPDGDVLTYTWTGPFGTANGATAVVPCAIGASTIMLTVDDGKGGTATDTVVVNVRDTTPPVITDALPSTTSLWPPNHKMVPVTVSVSASDLCSATTSCSIMAVSSNEPINGTGDGDTAPDWEITGNLSVNLRAERVGGGVGRIYTIAVQCADVSGNKSTRSVTVTVPHNKK